MLEGVDWALVIKLAGSVFGVLALWLVAHQMQLGGDPRITDTDHAIRLAFEGEYGFEGTDAVLDLGGYSALVRDRAGRHVLIWRLGNRFVTRMLQAPVEGRLDQTWLTLSFPEPGTIPITLSLGEAAQYWASGLRHIPAEPAHA